ncbi:hypothetical protein DACRYDRAFT_13191 [Dacryopinax primogenitus]|uniref:Uncharacterized protein n=1 Tax=Dacryopinax primogenitus (strain DJM 731) TaxID=1858805 RepID=M5GC34_DACPD|nr:uncharacterized protein DACRYDRAFT_13191 [Dacryopinax primogenitus]EJU06579.1 hypothetical protein DACRYDRAFT_13191 [Dacryopinax primogenitus]
MTMTTAVPHNGHRSQDQFGPRSPSGMADRTNSGVGEAWSVTATPGSGPASFTPPSSSDAGANTYSPAQQPTSAAPAQLTAENLPGREYPTSAAQVQLTADNLPGRDTTGAALEDRTAAEKRPTAVWLASGSDRADTGSFKGQHPQTQPDVFPGAGAGGMAREEGWQTDAPVGPFPTFSGTAGGTSTKEGSQHESPSVPSPAASGASGGLRGADGGAPPEIKGMNENEARRDDDFDTASEGAGQGNGTEYWTEETPGEEEKHIGRTAGIGVAGSRFTETGDDMVPQAAGLQGNADENEANMKAQMDNFQGMQDAVVPQGAEGIQYQPGDYVPDPSREGVYTAPHGYPTTGAQQPTTMNDLPLSENIRHVPEGGVSLHGQPGLPQGKPKLLDRVVGKVQQEVGRQTDNWEMYGKGVLRETGGSKAVKGQARAVI